MWNSWRRALRAATSSLLFVLVSVSGWTTAKAQSLRNVTYVGGTAITGSGLHGQVLVDSPDTLVFKGPSKLNIPYDRIIAYESKPHKEVHVGLLTEGLWRLIAPWPEGKQLSLSYGDSEDHPQVIVLQMSRGDEALLVEVLKTRVQRGGYRPPVPIAHPANAVVAQTKSAGR